MNNDQEKILDKLKEKDEVVINKLYNLYRNAFIEFAVSRYSLDNTTALDIYQESFITLYQNIHKGQLSTLTASLKTYIFTIGRNKIYNYYREKEKHAENIQEVAPDIPDSDNDNWLRKQEITYELVLSMNDPCNTVLRLYYWEQKSMADIAKIMNYRNEQVAKNRKSICMKNLKISLLNLFKKEELI